MRLIRVLGFASFLAFSLVAARGQSDFTFTGAVSSDWFNPANWLEGGVPATTLPTSFDNVTIGPNQVTAVVSNDVTVRNLELLNLGALDGPGDIFVNETFFFNSSAPNQNPVLKGAGTLWISDTMNVRGACNLLRNVYNAGTLALFQSGGTGPTLLLCATNIVITNQGAINLEDATSITGGATLYNFNQISKTNGTNTAYLGSSASSPGPFLVNLSGAQVKVSSGTLSLFLSYVGINFGEFNTDSNAVLLIHAGIRFGGNSLINGSGICRSDGPLYFPVTTNSGSILPPEYIGTVSVGGILELDPGGLIEPVSVLAVQPGDASMSVTGGGRFLWTGGTLKNLVCRVDSGATLVISSDFGKYMDSCVFDSQGCAEWWDNGSIVDQSSQGQCHFMNSGQFVIYGDGSYSSGGFPPTDFRILQGGSLLKTLSDPTNSVGPGSHTSTMQALSCYGGSVLVGSGTLSCSYSTLSNATLSVIRDDAVLQFGSGVVVVNGHTDFETTHAGLVYITSLETVAISTNVTLRSSGNLTLIGKEIIGAGTLHLAYGDFMFSGGTLGVSNLLIDADSVMVTTNGGGQGLWGCTVTNLGFWNVGVSVDLTGVNFNNAGGATIQLTQSADLTGQASTLNNQSLVTFPPAFQAHLYPTLLNSGTIELGGNVYTYGGVTQFDGNIDLGPAGQLSAQSITLDGGGILGTSLPGTGLVANLINNSPGLGISPGHSPGILQLNGNYSGTSNGTMTIELAGLAPGTEYDQFKISGSASLDGSLNVSLLNGFVPSSGNQFTVMTFQSLSGAFAAANGLKLPNGLYLLPVYSSTNLTLVTTNVTFLQPAIEIAAGSPASGPQLTWDSASGQTYQVQFSSDLIHWFVATNLIGSGSPLSFSDPSILFSPAARFYRLR